MIRSPLRYPGGKFKAMPQIMPHIPANVKDWREPFFGGGSVTIYYMQECLRGALQEKTGEKRCIPETLTVGDLNPEIWAFWQGCKTVPEQAAIEAMELMGEYATYYKNTFMLGSDFQCENVTDSECISKYTNETVRQLEELNAQYFNKVRDNIASVYQKYDVTSDDIMIEDIYKIFTVTRGEEEKTINELHERGFDVDKVGPLVKEIAKEMFGKAKEFFTMLKEVDTKDKSLAWRCARQFLINRISFSGMGDAGTLSKDQFMDFRISDVKKLVEVKQILKDVNIRNCSFEEIMRLEPMGTATKDEVYIFLDPPYLTQESSGLYGKNGEMHIGFPHQLFVDECFKTPYKFLVTYDDSVQVRRKLQYTMAGKVSSDALAGEELFIANFPLDDDDEDDDFGFSI